MRRRRRDRRFIKSWQKGIRGWRWSVPFLITTLPSTFQNGRHEQRSWWHQSRHRHLAWHILWWWGALGRWPLEGTVKTVERGNDNKRLAAYSFSTSQLENYTHKYINMVLSHCHYAWFNVFFLNIYAPQLEGERRQQPEGPEFLRVRERLRKIPVLDLGE